jgi:hypothetical protein
MNVKKLNEAMEVLKDSLKDALLACDIYTASEGQSIIGFNTNPKACALMNQITDYTINALNSSGFPKLGRYWLLDLTDDKMVMLLLMGDYNWGMYVDTKKTQLGLLLNIILPKVLQMFKEAVSE